MQTTTLLGKAYKNIFKPIAFKIDAETVHNRVTNMGEFISENPSLNRLTTSIFETNDQAIQQEILGVKFSSPVGLSAGFDYDGHLAGVMKSVGFGFNTVGTITAKPYGGNTKPRLARMPDSKALLVNKGFKSEGVDAVIKRLDSKYLAEVTVGASIGSSNLPEIDSVEKAIDDYLYSFNKLKEKDYIKYFELNISCPNITFKGKFTTPGTLRELVSAVSALHIKQPLFIKMPNEISQEDLNALIDVALEYGIRGIILSNLVKDRANPAIKAYELEKIKDLKGNISGKPTSENANKLISGTYRRYGSDIVIVGCGGIFSAHDAYEKIKAGASLVQLITGLIYEGPQLVKQINEGLSEFLKNDGYGNIAESIGITPKN